MPLGNPRDFGFVPEDDPVLPQEAQDAIAAEFGGDVAENLGLEDPFDGPEAVVGDNLGPEDQEAAMAELMAYINAMQPEYVVTPHDLTELVGAELITVDEARAYLAGKGVIGG